MAQYETREHDVLVIGAGGAGLRAAIEASAQGVSVGVVCKSLLGKAHTVMAEGGMAGALANSDSRDSWQTHFRDTMRGGKLLNDWRMVDLFVREAPQRIHELEEWGAVFDRTADGRINQRNFGGHRYPRLAHVGDRTGLEMIRTLQDYGVHQGMEVYMECCVLELLRDGERICGAVVYWRETGRFMLVRAKAIVLATGGLGKCYRITSNSWEGTGDGHALACRAGAELIDMEFVQFHPTGMVWPPSVRGILVTEGVRGEGGVLRNSRGERFLFQYIPPMFAEETAADEAEARRWLDADPSARRPPELLTRDVVARAIRSELLAGRGSPHGGAFLEIASVRSAEYIRRKLPSMHHQFLELGGLDITREPMEVGPTCHYMMGGVRVDAATTMSCVEGLFAAGEVAGGLHGANRLGGNSLTDLLVFGRRAGEHAAAYTKANPQTPQVSAERVEQVIRDARAPFEQEGGENPYTLTQELQECMERHAGIVREEAELRQGLQALHSLRDRATRVRVEGNLLFNPGWHHALDLRNLLCVSEAIALAALQRKESRGGHTREDFPQTDEALQQVNSIIRLRGEELECSYFQRPQISAELRELLR